MTLTPRALAALRAVAATLVGGGADQADLVTRVADHVTVLDAGRVLAEGPPDEVRSRPEVQQAYLGVDA